MIFENFIQCCNDLWPGKELTAPQWSIYRDKMGEFSDREADKIYEWLRDNSKFFPKIADIVEAARHCGFMDRVKAYAPHEWEASECRLCGGSGQLAVFYEQTFDPANGVRILTLKRVMQYQSSGGVLKTTDWTRYYYRCQCEQGEASTLEKGLPRWSPEKPSTVKLAI